MSDYTPIEQQLLAILGSQNPVRKKYHRLREAYPVINEMIRVGYLQVDINQIVNEGGLPLHFETFKTYLRRCRQAMADKAPVESRDTIQESAPSEPEPISKPHPAAVVNEEVSDTPRQNNRNLEAILDAREWDNDPDTDRYLTAKKPLGRRKTS